MSEVILPDHLVNNQAPSTTRDRILLTTIELLSQYSYSHVSLDMIAKHCSSTKQCILYHFRSKHNLTTEALGHITKEHEAYISKHASQDAGSSEQAADHVLNNINTLLFKNLGGQCLCRMVTFSTSAPAEFSQQIRDYFHIWETAIANVISLAAEQAKIVARIIVSGLIGTIISGQLYQHKNFHQEVLEKLKAEILA